MAKLIEITGKALSGEWGTDDETGEGIPVLRTTNFTNEGVVDYSDVVKRTITKKNIDDKYLRPGDIIIEKSGGSDKQPVGRVIYFDGPDKTYLFNNFTGLLRVKEQNKWFPKYVFYSLYGNYRRGGTRPFENKTTGLHNLKTDDYVSRYEVKEVEYSKQVKISSHLDKLYSIIKMREEELVKLDELIKARFVEMFGNPNVNEMNWDMGVINDIGQCVAGATPSTKVNEYWEDGTIPWMSSGEVNKGRIYETDTKISQLGYDNASTKLVPPKTVVLAMAGQGKTRGTTAITEIELCTNQSICSIVNNERVNPEYLLYFLKMQYKELRGASTNTDGRGGLNLKIIGNYPIMIPPINKQNEFEEFVKQVDKSKVAVQKALDEAQLLFDSLMQDYFG